MNGWYGHEWGMGGWVMMTLFMIVFWGGIIALIVFLVRRPGAGQGPEALKPPHHDAERILNERFAHGDIDEAELKARRAALRRS